MKQSIVATTLASIMLASSAYAQISDTPDANTNMPATTEAETVTTTDTTTPAPSATPAPEAAPAATPAQ